MLKDTPKTIYSVRGFLALIVSDYLYDLCAQPFGATPDEPLHHGISALDIGGGGALPSTKKVQLSPSGTVHLTRSNSCKIQPSTRRVCIDTLRIDHRPSPYLTPREEEGRKRCSTNNAVTYEIRATAMLPLQEGRRCQR